MSYADHPHLRATGYSEANSAKPSVAAGAAAGTSPTVSNTGADERGQVTVTAGSTPTTGTLVTVTFATPYAVAPDAVVVSHSDSVGNLALYASATTTALTIGCHTAPTATDVYKISYVVVGGA